MIVQQESHLSLIVSDVMMPELDGFELTRTLKNDIRTSHIPVILLTAKGDFTSKLEGLDQGADDYLSKPFQKDELLLRLKKLIELRKSLQEKYAVMSREAMDEVPDLARESAFLQKVEEIVHFHISDENFGIHELCKSLHISRSQLHRKLKALTGRSTSAIVRSIRLRRAKELLLTTDKNVSEVSFAFGYSNRSYFTQEFAREYGHPPSYFKKNNIQD